jgi:acyl carrier protein
MSRHVLFDRLEPIFREILDPDLTLTDDLDASQVPSWDSLNHITLRGAIESEFGVEIPANELASLRTVGDIARSVESKIG